MRHKLTKNVKTDIQQINPNILIYTRFTLKEKDEYYPSIPFFR